MSAARAGEVERRADPPAAERLWHPDLTEAEGLDMMMKGIEEVKRRLSVAPASFMIKVVDKDGIRHLATINPDEKLDKPPDFEA